jgi:hypothetical protein
MYLQLLTYKLYYTKGADELYEKKYIYCTPKSVVVPHTAAAKSLFPQTRGSFPSRPFLGGKQVFRGARFFVLSKRYVENTVQSKGNKLFFEGLAGYDVKETTNPSPHKTS